MGITVERVSAADLTPDEFVLKYVAENTPVILEGALSEKWVSSLQWTPSAFADLAPPDSTVRVAPLMTDGRDKWVESAKLWPGSEKAESLPGVVHDELVLAVAAARIDVPVSDFVASLHGEGPLPSLYADGASNLQHSFSFLESELPEYPHLGKSLLFKRKDLWLGSKTLSTLHFDNYENLFAQLVGEKEFLLCPPGDTRYLVDGRLRKAYATWKASTGEGCKGIFERNADGLSDETALNYAVYDIDAPPEEYAERASKLRRTVVRVRAGEVLYLPFGWWHQVRAIPAEHGLCASAASFFEPFFVRLQPKSFSTMGPLLPNPKYRKLCARLGLEDSDEEEEEQKSPYNQKTGDAEGGKGAGRGKGGAKGGYQS